MASHQATIASKPPWQARPCPLANAIDHMERQNPGLAELGGVSATTERDPTIQPAVDYEWPVVHRVGGTVSPGWLSLFTGQQAPRASHQATKQAIMQAPTFQARNYTAIEY
jgi:hypothetical protein